MLLKVVQEYAEVIVKLTDLCSELIEQLAQYTEIEQYEHELEEVKKKGGI